MNRDDVPPSREVRAGKIRVGDVIEWCGRPLRVERTGNSLKNWKRPAVYLWVTVNGESKCLHYYADEPVVVRSCEACKGVGEITTWVNDRIYSVEPCPRGCLGEPEGATP